jgi:hypothetical protein
MHVFRRMFVYFGLSQYFDLCSTAFYSCALTVIAIGAKVFLSAEYLFRFHDFEIVMRYAHVRFSAVCCINFLMRFPNETVRVLQCDFRMRLSFEILYVLCCTTVLCFFEALCDFRTRCCILAVMKCHEIALWAFTFFGRYAISLQLAFFGIFYWTRREPML